MHTLEKDKSDDEDKMYEEKDDDVAKELYGDVNITQGLKGADMNNVEQGGAHQKMLLTSTVQSSFVSSDFTSKLLNLDKTGPDVNEIASLMNTSNVPPLPPPVNPSLHFTTIPQQPTPYSTTTTTNPTIEDAQAENQEFLNQVDSTMKAIIKEQVKAQVFKIMPHIEKYVTESLGAKVLVRSTNQPQTSYAVATSLSEFELNKILIDKIETNESINRSDIQRNLYNALIESYNIDKDILSTYGDVVTLKRGRDDQDKDEDPSAGSNRGTKRRKREYPFHLSKPLPLIEDQGRQVVPANYFINNDLEYLKGGSSSSKYATFTTRTKAAKYVNIKGKKDMVPTLWSLVKVAYNKHAFKEGDFPRLNLRDIKDMLLLLVQKKLSNIDVDDRYDLGVALRMFTRRIVILYRVENLQLGVESYQKKLNITRPETTRLMRSDELYKLCDGTFSYVRSVLNDIASNLEMDYLPKRHWSNLKMKWSRIIVKAIDKLLFERRLMRNLEKFFSRRDYENDLRLLERTI
nr:hypothetical protein [Tanacetum cinerariifolium]